MKKPDLIVTTGVILFFLPFFLSETVLQSYLDFNRSHAYIMSFMKFAILATFGECIGLRIREGVYWRHGFGLLPRAFVWGIIGITIKAAFVIFAGSAPALLASLGVNPAPGPGILQESGFSWIKLLTAFTAGTMINLYFAPVFMTAHKITDLNISRTGGSFKAFFRPFDAGKYLQDIDWRTMWNFVFKKTLILFWIPAQTLNFMLPEEFRILFAAFLGIVLGVLLSVAGLTTKQKLPS